MSGFKLAPYIGIALERFASTSYQTIWKQFAPKWARCLVSAEKAVGETTAREEWISYLSLCASPYDVKPSEFLRSLGDWHAIVKEIGEYQAKPSARPAGETLDQLGL